MHLGEHATFLFCYAIYNTFNLAAGHCLERATHTEKIENYFKFVYDSSKRVHIQKIIKSNFRFLKIKVSM